MNYAGASGYVRVWQDGVAVLEGTYTSVAGTSLQRAHWGMYASGSITQGVQYNDEIQLWTLDGPWTDLDTEPPSPYALPPQDGGTPSDGPAATDGPSLADGALPADAPAGTDATTDAAPGDAAGDRTTAGGCGCHTAPPTGGDASLVAALLLGRIRRRVRQPVTRLTH